MSDDGAVDVVIEVPRGSRNKYEYDPDKAVIRLDRRLTAAMVYPADYGFIPETLAEDGDALDALVVVEEATFPGCWVRARPIGMLMMSDEHGHDPKLICVLANDPATSDIVDINQLRPSLLDEFSHFFDVYKDLDKGKHTVVEGWVGHEAAIAEVAACRRRAEAG